ncbi:hypothetical protein K488DRAFT_84487 [Vararia minispora EC-137]|uniref:Uncharacterized protein n=1 Tax=Vararia minispora EC-137 TaxID=1314806 RepID=A0ACB8QQ14_9AGAM|nr:hypothetical protein K488DRAFT_84487 [Vararia minispora EC-137]
MIPRVFAAVLAVTGSVLATPLIARNAPGCPGVFNSIGDVANFTLTAAYKNDTSLTRPLGLVPQTPSLFNSFIAVSDLGTVFTMVNSGIKTVSSSVAVSQPVSSNGFLEFVSFTSFPPTQIYCEFYNTDPNGSLYPYPLLAVNSDSDHFSICPGGLGRQQEVVVYNSTSSCDEVVVMIVQ